MKFLVPLFASLGLLVSSVSGFTLQIVEGSYTWQEAKADAESRGGRLAVLNTQDRISATNSYLNSLGVWPGLWIGLTDQAQEGHWKWLSGESLSEENWSHFVGAGGPEPNNKDGNEHYAVINSSINPYPLVWNDVPNNYNDITQVSYLLEVVPEPSTYALLLGGTVLGYAFWRRMK
jgi:hypothetical protein